LKKVFSVLLTLAVVVGLSLVAAPAVAADTTYSYSETWGPSGVATPGDPYTVDVTVADTGDGWLQWTYTYSESPTHTPKMTVAINYPNGFAITTFDDGSHTGWYYAPDPDEESTRVWFADYSGGTYNNWTKTTASGNVLTVKIKKSALGHTFKWHGYANVDGQQVWIETDENWLPTAEVTLEDVTAVGLTADVPDIVAISASPSAINFGTLYPGQTSGEGVVTVTNIGTHIVDVDASVTGSTLFMNNLQLVVSDSWATGPAWTDVITGLLSSKSQDVRTRLVVPSDYTPTGTETGLLVFEATAL